MESRIGGLAISEVRAAQRFPHCTTTICGKLFEQLARVFVRVIAEARMEWALLQRERSLKIDFVKSAALALASAMAVALARAEAEAEAMAPTLA